MKTDGVTWLGSSHQLEVDEQVEQRMTRTADAGDVPAGPERGT